MSPSTILRIPSLNPSTTAASGNGGARAAERQRRVQKQVEAVARGKTRSKGRNPDQEQTPPQTGARFHPTVPLPAQHLEKPGLESEMQPAPQFMAPDYLGSQKLLDRVALITGGDSGIGRAVAVLFAREGADVALVYLNEHSDAKVTAQCVENEGRRCLLIPGDVSDPRFCQQAVRTTIEDLGPLDILVNNAAFQEHVDAIEDLSDEHFDLTLKTNLYGYFYMTKAAVPHLRAGGSIINSGSVTGLFGSPKLIDYSTTKGAIHAFTCSLATHLIGRGIRVNAVAPGPVWTPLNLADKDAEGIRHFGESTDMKRPAQPEEIAPAYVFLAAPACASYITGIVLPVMGGVTGGA